MDTTTDFTPESPDVLNLTAAAKAALEGSQMGTFQALTGLPYADARAYAHEIHDAVPPVLAVVRPF